MAEQKKQDEIPKKVERIEKREREKEKPVEVMYKMNMYLPNGTIRSEIPKGVLHVLGRDWGDIMRCVPSHRWSTMEEIVNLVWDFERRSYLKSFNRTRKQIEDGVKAAVEAGVILTK